MKKTFIIIVLLLFVLNTPTITKGYPVSEEIDTDKEVYYPNDIINITAYWDYPDKPPMTCYLIRIYDNNSNSIWKSEYYIENKRSLEILVPISELNINQKNYIGEIKVSLRFFESELFEFEKEHKIAMIHKRPINYELCGYKPEIKENEEMIIEIELLDQINQTFLYNYTITISINQEIYKENITKTISIKIKDLRQEENSIVIYKERGILYDNYLIILKIYIKPHENLEETEIYNPVFLIGIISLVIIIFSLIAYHGNKNKAYRFLELTFTAE